MGGNFLRSAIIFLFIARAALETALAQNPGAASGDPLAAIPAKMNMVVEYFHFDANVRDMIYGDISTAFGPIKYMPSQALGMAFPPGTRGVGLIPVYRCAGFIRAVMPNWGLSFYSTSTSCAGNQFDGGKVNSAGETMVIYASPPKDIPSVALYRYRMNGEPTTVLSTVPPTNPQNKQDNLAIMNYQLDPVAGAAPIGYLIKMDAKLDGNQRWISGINQNLCYGISSYQTTCPTISTSSPATWSLFDLRSGASVFSSVATTQLGLFSITGAQIAQILSSGSAKANAPMLLTLNAGGKLIAAKNVRIIRTPFVAQYDNNVVADDDGDPTSFATASSALLLANQMTAHRAFTDPLVNRTFDPALYDAIVSSQFYSPDLNGAFPTKVDAKQSHAFQVLDSQGVLVGAEIGPFYMGKNGRTVIPFDITKQIDVANVPAGYAAQWFNPATGLFESYGKVTSLPIWDPKSIVTPFFLDFANPDAVAWVSAGIPTYLARLYKLGIHPAIFSFSESMLQSNVFMNPDTTSNNGRLPYYQSPTFSDAAYTNFHAWLPTVGAPSTFWGLPVLPQDYQKAQAAGNPAMWRIQSADPSSKLWWYWGIWRRGLYSGALGKMAIALKAYHASQPYTRAPISTILYQYINWFTIDASKYDLATGGTWNDGIWNDPNSTTYVDPGEDFLFAAQLNPTGFDYYVSEDKDVAETQAIAQAQRMLQFKNWPGLPVVPKIGLHMELEAPYSASNSNYLNVNMGQVFPNNSFSQPTFDLVWAWEAQCEYLMTMKTPDASGTERLNVQINYAAPTAFQVVDPGNYANIINSYSAETGPWCLYRHANYNLPQSSMAILRDNMSRMLNWRAAYLRGQ